MANAFRESYESSTNYALRPSYLTQPNYGVRTNDLSMMRSLYQSRYQGVPTLTYTPTRMYQPALTLPPIESTRPLPMQPELEQLAEDLGDLPFELIMLPARRPRQLYPAQAYISTYRQAATSEPQKSRRDELAEKVAQELQDFQPLVMQHV